MENILLWITVGIVALIAIGYLTLTIIKIIRMSPEERKTALITYIKGAVALAERDLGEGKGAAKLEQVEKYFNTHASWFLKILLTITGKETYEI